MSDTPAVRMGPPPPPVLRVMNPVIGTVVSSPLGRFVGGLAVIAFVGRRSSCRYRTPVALHVLDGAPHVFTDRAWRHNFAGGAPVDVVFRGAATTTTAVLLDIEPDAIGTLIRRALDDESPRALGMRIARGHDPTAAELGALGQSAIRIEPVGSLVT